MSERKWCDECNGFVPLDHDTEHPTELDQANARIAQLEAENKRLTIDLAFVTDIHDGCTEQLTRDHQRAEQAERERDEWKSKTGAMLIKYDETRAELAALDCGIPSCGARQHRAPLGDAINTKIVYQTIPVDESADELVEALRRAEQAEDELEATLASNASLRIDCDDYCKAWEKAEAALAERDRMLRMVCDAFKNYVDCPLESGCHYEGESGVPCGKCIIEHFREHEFGDGLIARSGEG